MGSYAVIRSQELGVRSVRVEDIYQPDGQLVGYVEPPAPIKKAFPFGSWKLRDANWDPDFPKTAETLMWYFKKAGEGEFDGVIATNLLVF